MRLDLARFTTDREFEGHYLRAFLYQNCGITICIQFKDIKDTLKRQSILFPPSYKPTWNELKDAVSQSFQLSCSYSEEQRAWLFSPPAPPAPYTVDIPHGWQLFDRLGPTILIVSPQLKPDFQQNFVGISYCGHYSFELDSEKNFKELMEKIALKLAARFNEKIDFKTLPTVKTVDVNGTPAFYYEFVRDWGTARTHRNWILMKDSEVVAIGSDLPVAKDATLLPDLQSLVNSFKIRGKEDKK